MKSNSIVCIGSKFFSGLDIVETAQEEHFNEMIYDRSCSNLTVCQAEEYFKKTVAAARPLKLFINIGDVDLVDEEFRTEYFMMKYEWMLFSIHTLLPSCRIYIVSVISNHKETDRLNDKLKELALQTGCDFVDISKADKKVPTSHEVFSILKCSMRKFPIGFSDAMSYSA
ncbi:MAG: hypothetical protein HUK25_04450 [Treponema sp.]|nr:hypothetical protein [Treponema sp.]